MFRRVETCDADLRNVGARPSLMRHCKTHTASGVAQAGAETQLHGLCRSSLSNQAIKALSLSLAPNASAHTVCHAAV